MRRFFRPTPARISSRSAGARARVAVALVLLGAAAGWGLVSLHRRVTTERARIDTFHAAIESEVARVAGDRSPRLDRLRAAYTESANRADRTTFAVGAVLLLLSSTLLGLLAWRHRGERRSAAQLALQERVLRDDEVRFRSLVQHASDVIAVTDGDWRVHYCSPAALPRLGFSPDEMEGVRLLDLVHPDDAVRAAAFVRELAAAPGETHTVVWRLRHASGRWIDAEAVATNLLHDAVIAGIVVNTRDVSERVALESRLTHQASHDALTNLSNRAVFRARVEHAVERADPGPVGPVVLFLDLDDFKTINDTLGHDQGDQLLTEAADRFLGATRGRDLVARMGGDEFAILLENVRDVLGAVRVAERIAQALREPFRLAGRDIYVTASVGIACWEPEKNADALMRDADVAMYAAKSRGKGRFEVFHGEMYDSLIARMELEGALRSAVEAQQIEVAYLPLVDLDTGVMRGLEALARWSHPTRGLIPAATFVGIAEETGLIVPLGRQVLEMSCRRAAEWQATLPGGASLALHVNVSPRQLLHPGFVDMVRRILADSGLVPGSLALELSEINLLYGSDVLRERLEQLRALNVAVVLDDFGTGYASLGDLRRFAVDAIKVDRTFVARVADGGMQAALTAAVLSFGRALGLRTVAEGVETPEQVRRLRELGCDDAQGFLFTPPLDAEAMSSWLRARLDADEPAPVEAAD